VEHKQQDNSVEGPVLVTGATGYVGGRLVPRLLEAGYRVRCLARSARKLEARPWARDARVEIVEAGLDDADAVEAAMRGCGAAYYLVHSMVATGSRYAEADRRLAERFARAAARARVGRIVYLGGLGEQGDGLSEHLSSRREVEAVLAAGAVPVTVLRAAMIIGSGSASFEILRYLVERLPVLVTPRWVRTRSQPIAISNVLNYLVACLSAPATVGRTLDIGGPDIVSYLDLMRIMAEERGLRRRLVIPVPVLTPLALDPPRHATESPDRPAAGRRIAQPGRVPRRRSVAPHAPALAGSARGDPGGAGTGAAPRGRDGVGRRRTDPGRSELGRRHGLRRPTRDRGGGEPG